MWQSLHQSLLEGDARSLARIISLVENEQPGYEAFLAGLRTAGTAQIIGITGPPGAGKSTLTDGIIKALVAGGSKVGVLCVDPSSPFHMGSVLGDRIRMSQWYTHPGVFIRSLATRGSMGGLHPKIIELTEILKAARFDHIIVETVGVGQSEVEIAGLADTTVVVLVPESGDEVQTMKAGLMEIADIFVVNKSDRPDADIFVKNLRSMLAPAFSKQQVEVPIVKTVASQEEGLAELVQKIRDHQQLPARSDHRNWLLAEKAWMLLQGARMKGVSRQQLLLDITASDGDSFNLFQFVQQYAQPQTEQ